MQKILLIVTCLYCLSSCNAQPASKKNTKPVNTKKMEDGKDYIILKRFRAVDKQGFNQPVEVASYLLPANWQVNTSVQWNPALRCIIDMVQISLLAKSPDGVFELMVFPTTQFDWSNDQRDLADLNKNPLRHACNMAPPLEAAGYINTYIAPYLKATVKSVSPVEELQQQLNLNVQQLQNIAMQAGNNMLHYKATSAEAKLQFGDGKEGIAFCAIVQTTTQIPGMPIATYQCKVPIRIVVKYTNGNESMARKIVSTFTSSLRNNPSWSNAVQKMMSNVIQRGQAALGQQIEINHKAQQEISNGIVRNWENRQSNSGGGTNAEGFNQLINGVETWKDGSGNKVELTSGYTNAWSRGDGSYYLSNNPANDPNVELGGTQSWSRLKQ